MRRILYALGVLVLSVCGVPEPVADPAGVAIEVGRPFPDLVLPAIEDRSPSSIARFRGKKTLLHVFASW